MSQPLCAILPRNGPAVKTSITNNYIGGKPPIRFLVSRVLTPTRLSQQGNGPPRYRALKICHFMDSFAGNHGRGVDVKRGPRGLVRQGSGAESLASLALFSFVATGYNSAEFCILRLPEVR